MSSTALPKDLDTGVLGRLSALENQHRRAMGTQAEILAEVRGMRDDFQKYAAAISDELTRVYKAVMPRE